MPHKYTKKSAAADKQQSDQADKQNRALQFRRQGLTFVQIAKEMGCSPPSVHAYVQDAIKAIPLENAKEILAIELERLDRDLRRNEKLLDKLESRALAGDDKAVANVVRLHESNRSIQSRRSKYLGLDAPVKTQNEHTGLGGGPIETKGATDALLDRLARLASAGEKAEGSRGPKS